MNYTKLDLSARILIVEDEGIVAADISRRLEKLGFEVAGISNSAEEAVDIVSDLCPNLILMDITLSGLLDGIEGAAQILKKFDVPIIFLTAHTDPETMERAKQTAPFGYLTKPIQQHSLSATIDIALYKHRVERELREQRAWLSTILTTIQDGVAVADTSGSVQYLNPAAEKMTGWNHSDALAHPLSSVLAGSNSESQARIEELLAETLERAKPSRLPRRLRVAPRLGQAASFDGEIAPSLDCKSPLGAVVTFRDVTDCELEEQQRRHEHKIRAVGTLAAGVAHDFNNLLMVITGYPEELGSLDLEVRAHRAVEQIRKAAQSASSITQQLLQFSRKQETQRKDLDLNDVVRDAGPLLRRVAGLDVIVEMQLCPEKTRLSADPDQLTQILVNLTANARDAMPNGGGLTIETRSLLAEEAPFESKRPGVILSVKDSGLGMSDAVVDRLFEPFFTTKEAGKGTGLGLSIVQSIVSDLGGVIRVESRPNVGSTFLIYLPQLKGALLSEAVPEPPQKGVGEAKEVTVLLVDDEDGIRELLAAYLASTNYKVLTAASGAEALALAESYSKPINALITDLMMPGMNGLELANELKRRGLTSPILFISGYPDKILEAMDFPETSAFLPKPFSRMDLVNELNRMLGGKKAAKSTAA